MNKEKLYENYWKERNKKEPNRIIKAGKSFSLFNSDEIPLIKDVMIWSYEEGAKAERDWWLQKLELMRTTTYPEDIFTRPTKEQYNELDKILEKLGTSIDAYSGDLMRRSIRVVIENMKKELKQKHLKKIEELKK